MAEEYLESEIVFSDSTNESVHKCNHKEIDHQLPMNHPNYNTISQFQQQIQHITAPADHSLTDSTLTTSKLISSNQLNTSNKSVHPHRQQKAVNESLNSSAPMKIPVNSSTHYDRRHRRRKQELVNDDYSEDEDDDDDDVDYQQVSIMHNDYSTPHPRHPHHHQQQRMVPPHVILAKRIAQSVVSSSVHIENGRALRVRARGRSLYQVRDSILRMTGFIES